VKITDVSVTMFNWQSAAWRTGTGAFGGHRLLGGDRPDRCRSRGPCLSGSSRQGADAYAGPLMEFVKLAIMGEPAGYWHHLAAPVEDESGRFH
jgi:hypothetical protein